MQIRQIFKDVLNNKQNRLAGTGKAGVLGDGNGTVRVPGLTGYVYVRIDDQAPIPVYNCRVPEQDGLAVLIGPDPIQPGFDQVLSVRGGTGQNPGANTPGLIGAHSDYHRYPNPGWFLVEGEQFAPLRLDQASATSGSPMLTVYPATIWTGTEYATVSSSGINLYGDIPAVSGQARMVLVTVDTSGSIITTAGTSGAASALALTSIPDPPAGTVKILGAVRLYNTQDILRRAQSDTDFLDLRMTDLSGGTSGSSTPLSDALSLAIGQTASAGSSGSSARGDHVHALPISTGLSWSSGSLIATGAATTTHYEILQDSQGAILTDSNDIDILYVEVTT
jgi:hypothetical protein